MKKKRIWVSELICSLIKFWKVMRLSLFFVLFFVSQSWALKSFSQQARLSMEMRDVKVIEVLNEIENQTSFFFLFNQKLVDVNRKVDINVDEEEVGEILTQLFDRTNVRVMIKDRQIILTTESTDLSVQQKNIRGKVTDSSGQSLPGVTVVIKGTTTGTITDDDGNYSISGVSGDAILVFSFVGMKKQEIPVKGKETIDVTLSEESVGIEEVVAIGYGTVKKSDLTGAVSSLDEDVFVAQPTTSLEQGIQGRLAGVQVLQSSGQPGAGISVRVRGVSSFAGGTEPLYVVDGIPLYNFDVSGNNGLSTINPNDIASVEVLKDAAATSIYGSRASNGVILVTTKSGKQGSSKLTYTTYFAVQNLRKKIDLMSGDEYSKYVLDYYNNPLSGFSSDEIAVATEQLNLYGGSNTDWQDEIYNPAIQQSHDLSISGGTEQTKYFMSVGYLNQDGIAETTNFKRYSLRVNLDNKIGERVRLVGRMNISKAIQNGFVAFDGTNTRQKGKNGVGSVLTASPNVPPFNSDGTYADVSPFGFSGIDLENPYALTEALDRNTTHQVLSSLDLDIKLLEGLNNRTRLGVDYSNRRTDSYFPSTLPNLGAQTIELDTREQMSTVLENFMEYNKTFTEDINLKATAGVSFQEDNLRFLEISAADLPTDDLENNSIQAASTISPPVTNIIKSVLVSQFVRADINLYDKYLFSSSVRRDGSSRFGEDNKYSIFPAFSAAWRISNEEFIKNLNVSNLKLRASWGKSGNQAIDPYTSLTIAEIVSSPQGSGTSLIPALAPNLPSPSITWETTTQTNIGLDLSFVNNRYRLGVDYYHKVTDDLIANVSLPASSGFSEILDNVGKIKNSGLELVLGATTNISNDLEFDFEFNLSKNTNEVLQTNGGKDILSSREGATVLIREGESISSFYLVKFLGFDEDGNPLYDDLNNDGTINDLDRQVVGTSLPDFVYGLNINGTYKKFTLDMNWQGTTGGSIHNSLLQSQLAYPDVETNKIRNIKDFFPNPSAENMVKSTPFDDRFLEDASYLRLKNIKLGYHVLMPSSFANSLNLYVSVQNLLTITNYSGYDPEVNTFSGNDLRQGVDNGAYPSVKTFTLGLNVIF